MSRRKLSDDEKLKLVLASFGQDVVITDFCSKHGISRSALYAWQKAVLVYLARGLHKRPSKP